MSYLIEDYFKTVLLIIPTKSVNRFVYLHTTSSSGESLHIVFFPKKFKYENQHLQNTILNLILNSHIVMLTSRFLKMF